MEPVCCHVAVVGSTPSVAEHWCEILNTCVRNNAADHSAPFTIIFVACGAVQAALQLARDDVELQSVIITAGDDNNAAQWACDIKAIRSELSFFLLSTTEGIPLVAPFAGKFSPQDANAIGVFNAVQRELQVQAQTPFADALRDYIYSAKDSWHTPGHSNGDSLRNSPWVGDFYHMLGGNIFNADLSVSVQMLDSLQDPHSVIRQAQALAAQTFGSQQTFFITNGTSTANKIIVQYLLGGGGKILLDRGSHKSLHHAVIMFGLNAVYLNPSVQAEYGLYGPVSKQTIYAAIEANPDASLLALTCCTYDGLYYDLQPIIQRAHAKGIKVLIDEAWYAHGYFHPALRPTALECGADYVTQSTHKMLSAFSQSSMLHCNDPDLNTDRLRESINMHTSTSPQYAMIACLDVARKQVRMEGYKKISQCLDISRYLRQAINCMGVFRVLTLNDMLADDMRKDGIRLDPTKLTVDISASGYSGEQLQGLLFQHYGIQVEKNTNRTISILVALGATVPKMQRLIDALEKITQTVAAPQLHRMAPLPLSSEIICLPHAAYFGRTEELVLATDKRQINLDMVGRVSANMVVPYPPGIPLLVPGQVINLEIAEYLLQLTQCAEHSEIHGTLSRDGNLYLRVCLDLSH